MTSVLLAASTYASASPVSVTVVGDACDFGGLDGELSNLLAGNDVAASRASVAMSRSGQTLTADVLVVDADGQPHGPRTVTATSCTDLLDSVAVVIAMAVSGPAGPTEAMDPAPAEEPPPTSAPDALGSSTLAPEATLAVTHAVTVQRPSPLSIDGYIAGARSTTSSASEQLQLGARLKRGAASISLQIGAGVPDEVQVTTTGKVTITQAELTVAPCAHFKSLSGCALLSAGVLHGSGESLYGARVVSVPTAATGLRVGWEHFFTDNVAFRLHLDGRAMLTTVTFDVDYMPVWQSSRFEGSAAVGLLARFL